MGIDIQQKVGICSEILVTCGKEITGNFSGCIKECKKGLKHLRSKIDIQSQEKYKETKKKIHLILSKHKICLAPKIKTIMASIWRPK